jgi:hypothetical protein
MTDASNADQDLQRLRAALGSGAEPAEQPALQRALRRIGQRTPREWADRYMAHRLRVASGIAAGIFVLLSLFARTSLVETPPRENSVAAAEPPALVTLEEDGFATYSTEPSLLAAVLVGEEE